MFYVKASLALMQKWGEAKKLLDALSRVPFDALGLGALPRRGTLEGAPGAGASRDRGLRRLLHPASGSGED